MRKLGIQQRLVLWTSAAAAALVCAAMVYLGTRTSDAIRIETAGLPTIGDPKAKVSVIVFEDFLCKGCRIFNEEIFPQIESRYVAFGHVRYTLIPLGFMEDSKPLGNAAFAVHKIAPDRFFSFAKELFRTTETVHRLDIDLEILLDLAKKVGGIDLKRFEECVRTKCYFSELDSHYEKAKELFGERFGTPAILIDGVLTPPSSFRLIQFRIDKALGLPVKETP